MNTRKKVNYQAFNMKFVLLITTLVATLNDGLGQEIVSVTKQLTEVPIEKCTSPNVMLRFQMPISVS